MYKHYGRGKNGMLYEQRREIPNPAMGQVGVPLCHVSWGWKDKGQELAKKRTGLNWSFWEENPARAETWRWKITWLVWRIALGPVLLKHKVWCRYTCKIKSVIARHLLEDIDFTQSATRPLKVLRLCVRGGRRAGMRPVSRFWRIDLREEDAG